MLSMRSMVPSPRGPATPGNTTTTVSSNNTTAGSFSYHQALVLGLLEKRRRPPTNKPTFDSSTTMNAMMPIAYGGYSTGPLVDVMSYSNNSSVMGSQCLQMNSDVLQMQPSANSFTCTVRTSSEHSCPQERVSSVVALMTPEQQKCSQRPPRAFTIEAILGLDRPLEHHKHSNYHHHLQRLHHHHHHVHRATSLQHHLQSVDKRACWTNNCISPDSQTSINLPLSNSNNLSTTTTVTAETVAKIAPKRKHSSSGCKELKRSLSSTADGSSGDEICEKPTKSKRVRTIFTPEQLERLEGEFERQQYMVGSERLYLAASLNLTEAQVKVWFQNRRIKWRRQHLAMQQARLAKIRASDDNEDEIKDCALEDTYGDSNDEADLNDETSSTKGAFPKYTSDL